MTKKYQLRFFFDYGSGGCLWCDNDAAYQKFGVGILDAEIYDLNGIVIEEPKIKLPQSIRQKILELDKLYLESLNWDDPAGQSLWDKKQWEIFNEQTRGLHRQIALTLGDEYEIIYKQE